MRTIGMAFVGAALAWGAGAEETAPLIAAEKRTDKESAWPADKMTRDRTEWLVKAMESSINQKLAELRRETSTKQQQPALLSRAVRLEFRVEPAGTEDRSLVVRTATDRFSAAVGTKGRAQSSNLRVGGQIQIKDGDQILVIYDTLVEWGGAEGTTSAQMSGGVKLVPGRPTTIATLGDRQWVVVGTFDEASPPIAQK